MSVSEYFPIYNKLSAKDQERLVSLAQLRKVSQGTIIHNGGADIQLAYTSKHVDDVILNIRYLGDTGEVSCDGLKVMDQFCNGMPLQISLGDLDLPEKVTLKILPLEESVPVYMEVPVTYTDGKAAYVEEVTAEVLYRNLIL